MKTNILLKKLEGVQTIKSIMSLLKINKNKAIYYVHRLRKKGYVKTKKLSNNIRVYNISFENKLGGTSYYEIINEYSPIKIAISRVYRIYGKRNLIEEALIYAIKTKSLRTILAALALFRKIEDWTVLYNLAKGNHLERQVGALYDLLRKITRVKRMPKKFRNNSLPKNKCKFEYIIKGLKSKDFKDVEKTWKVYIPFNYEDLREYK